MYNFQALNNSLGILSATVALQEMHYIDQVNPADSLDEFFRNVSFERMLFTGDNKRLISKYIDQFVKVVKDSVDVLGQYSALRSCIGSDHCWGFRKAGLGYNFTVQFRQSKIMGTFKVVGDYIDYDLRKDGIKVFDANTSASLDIDFRMIENVNPLSYVQDNCFQAEIEMMQRDHSNRIPLTSSGLVALNAKLLEHLRKIRHRFKNGPNGHTRETIMGMLNLKYAQFQDQFYILNSVGLIKQHRDLYFYNFEGIEKVVSKLESIDYFGVGKTTQVSTDLDLIERIWNSKTGIIRSQMTSSQRDNVERAIRYNKPYVEFIQREGDRINRVTGILTERGKTIYQTYMDIYKILESYVLAMNMEPKQLEVA